MHSMVMMSRNASFILLMVARRVIGAVPLRPAPEMLSSQCFQMKSPCGQCRQAIRYEFSMCHMGWLSVAVAPKVPCSRSVGRRGHKPKRRCAVLLLEPFVRKCFTYSAVTNIAFEPGVEAWTRQSTWAAVY
jgi:hypothetical protein